MIDTKLLAKYSREKSFIGSDYTSGYNFADRYYVKYDSNIRQYFLFPAGRIFSRIYELPKGQRIDAAREIVGLMLACEDTALPEAIRTEFYNKLPLEIQNYLQAQKLEAKPQAEPEIKVVNTNIKTNKEKELATVKEPPITEPEKAETEPIKKQKHKGGRPRTREATGRKYVHIWINETEHEAIKQLLSAMRAKK